ncbi:MAG: MBL fold metallo-hydrolase [Pseudoalteromonas sp.]|nr:MBL fold metallo-hydrolase [Pseudoalteromonas sp.]
MIYSSRFQVFSADSGKVVVFDTGIPSQRPAICRALKRNGVTAKEVTEVVQSHIHYDHASNAGMFQNADFYSQTTKMIKNQ